MMSCATWSGAWPTAREPDNYRISSSGYTEVQVYLTNGIRTSQGRGPSVKVLPMSEAVALVSAKLAVYGYRAPEAAEAESVARRFGGPVPPPRPAHSNSPSTSHWSLRQVPTVSTISTFRRTA